MTTSELLPEAVLVMSSGGVDSTYVLWKQLQDTNIPVHAHHISLRTVEDRYQCEDAAFQKVTEYLQTVRAFTTSTSIVDYRILPYPGWDTDAQLMVAARVAANMAAERVTVMLGITADDNHKQEVQARLDRDVIPTLWNALLNSIDPEFSYRVVPVISLPIGSRYKKELVKEMPPELLKLTWSCREPIWNEKTTEFEACGKCEPCLILCSEGEKRDV